MIFVLLALACGSEMTAAKLLRDPGAARALAPAPTPSTIAALSALPRTARRRSYSVDGTVTLIKHESDQDFHIVLEDGGATMIVEAADPRCATGSLAIAAIRRARKQAAQLRVGQRVRAVGMLFFDKLHGQSGVAPNGVELHPLYSIEVAQ